MGEEQEVGAVTGYFSRIGVAAIDVTAEVKVGDALHFKGNTTDLTANVESMQVENKAVEKASPGDKVGIKVPEKVRNGDTVYKAA